MQLCGQHYPVTVDSSHKGFDRKEDFCAKYFRECSTDIRKYELIDMNN